MNHTLEVPNARKASQLLRRVYGSNRKLCGRLNRTRYLVSLAWVRQWKGALASPGTPSPKALDNSALVEGKDRTLRRGLARNVDLLAVSEGCWTDLVALFKSGPEPLVITRRVVQVGRSHTLELYPVRLRVKISGPRTSASKAVEVTRPRYSFAVFLISCQTQCCCVSR